MTANPRRKLRLRVGFCRTPFAVGGPVLAGQQTPSGYRLFRSCARRRRARSSTEQLGAPHQRGRDRRFRLV